MKKRPGKDNGKDEQMTFEFNMKPEFKKCSGTCACGHKWEYQKSIDANHPLAGQDLTFEIEVLEIK